MEMKRSLLLGSAAAFVAVTGAQAADLPVKAKPVEYVKICTLYGEGYYYIPGSDTCLKFGGYVRGDYGWNTAGARTPPYSGTQGAQDRTVSRYSTRHRFNIQVDTRTQTNYGVLRTFGSIHMQNEDGVFSNNAARAFIQWAGFTIGHAQSFQDTFGITDSYHYMQQQNNSDTGANGVNQIAYTWELGNGANLTIGADEVRRKPIINLSNGAALGVGREALNSYTGESWPDAHIDFKVNQAWGYWATSFVAHDVSATYYNCTGQAISNSAPVTNCGHPSDKIGWAAQTGAEFKLDFINPGDRFGFMARYAQGASGFGGGSNLSSAGLFGAGNNVAVGFMSDAVFTGGTAFSGSLPVTSPCNQPGVQLPNIGTVGSTCNASQLQLTTTWTVGAAYEHLWTPNLKTSVSGAYTSIEYNNTAKSMFAQNVCGLEIMASAGVMTGGGQGQFNGGISIPGATTTLTQLLAQGGAHNNATGSAKALSISNNCDPDWGYFQGGIRTQWSPSRGFILGMDVTYTHVFTAFKGTQANLQNVAFGASSGNANVIQPVVGARPNGVYNLKDLGILSVVMRAQRNFNAGD